MEIIEIEEVGPGPIEIHIATDVIPGPPGPAGPAGGAPTTVDYLVGTADPALDNEIVVGTAPGGELGGTWAAPTVDAVHSGSSHASVQAAAEATAAAALAASEASTDAAIAAAAANAAADLNAHVTDATDAHDASAISILDTANDFTATNVEGALAELQTDSEADAAALAAHLADATDAHDASAISFVPNGSIAATNVQDAIQEVRDEASGGGAPDDATYLVTAANAGLTSEVVVGATPGGELGGTWAAPTVDATHSGSSHAAVQAAAEATAAAALGAHLSDASDAHDASAISFVPNGSIAATDVQAAIQEVRDEAGSAGAPTTADYLVGTAQGGLSAEIVVGTTPGGELGGTWAAPTVDATHSGSSHAAVQAAAEATAAAALAAHLADTSDAHDASAISILDTANDFTATDVEGALAELQSDNEADEAALAAHLADTSDAHDASAVSVLDTAGYFSATDVEAALAELRTAYITPLETQCALQAAQIECQRLANLGQFVCSGLALTPNATPTKLDMAAGTQFADTTELNAAAQAAIATTIASLEHATLPKWVVVELDASNVVQFNQGAAAAAPVFPTISTNRTPLGFLYVPSSAVNTTHQVDQLLTVNNGLAKLIDARVVRDIHPARLLFTDTAATSQALTSGTPASLLAATYTLPANSLNVGDTIVIEGSFRYINTVNASTLILRIVATTGNLIQYTIPSMAANASARWGTFRLVVVVKAIGASTGSNVELEVVIATSAPSATTPAAQFDVATGGTNTGLDTTANQVIDLTVQSSAASSTVALRAFTIYKIPA